MASKDNGNGNNGPKLTWKLAQSVLNDAEIKRLACCYFHIDSKNIDWPAAAEDYGSASANSYRTMIHIATKKLREAAARGETGNGGASSATAADRMPPTATPGSKTKGGKKRKVAGEDGRDGTEAPKTKKSRGTAKKPGGHFSAAGMQEFKEDNEEDVKPEPED